MHVVGVDLAWSERKPTGLAVLDESGGLLDIASVATDEEIIAALEPYVDGACLVAVGAPLIVTNPTGNRAAEAALNRDFSRFDAGAHPSNTGKAEFATKPRGARLAARLGLDVNPRSGRARRAIEVYPHPATIALFSLGRTLKYKNKPGRSIEQLRSELLTLIGLLEGLSSATVPLRLDTPQAGARWQALRAGVEGAVRKSQVREAEDKVDAVVCAYVGLLTLHDPAALTTYGDFETGYIFTPTLPADHQPTPRATRAIPSSIDTAEDPAAAVREYAARQPDLRRHTEAFIDLVTSLLDEAGINYLTTSGRAKSVASFAGKAARTSDGVPAYPDPLNDIADQIGLRVITYALDDITAVAHLVHEQFVVIDDRDMGLQTASEGRFGYASRHLHVTLDEAGAARRPDLAGLVVQIQLRTVLQHAWAEFEHDIRYKGTVPDEHVPDLDRRFTLAAGLLELADREFSTIRARLRESMSLESSPGEDVHSGMRLSPRELAAFLAGQYSDAGWSRTEHYDWIAGLLVELEITSLGELGEALREVDEETLTRRMDYRYPPAAVRRLDDALLWAHGESYLTLPSNAHRVEALTARLTKMRTRTT